MTRATLRGAVPIAFDPIVLLAALLLSAALLLLAWTLGVSGIRAVRATQRWVIGLRARIALAERELPFRVAAARAELRGAHVWLARRRDA